MDDPHDQMSWIDERHKDLSRRQKRIQQQRAFRQRFAFVSAIAIALACAGVVMIVASYK